tara:strand:+ start:317 stop:946 length:630 start_codon:yes stop_codon:yes gene_type:complete
LIKFKKNIKPSSKNWISRQLKDKYVKKAKIDGYRSRSAYKLIEIDKKFNIFLNKKNFLDLGSAPGGWTQVATKKIKNGKILSLDLLEMLPIYNSEFILGDFTKNETQKKIDNFFKSKIDIIVSDMAQNTTGHKKFDSLNTGNLCIEVINFSKSRLKSNGVLIFKIFMGSIFKEVLLECKRLFSDIKVYKPDSSRSNSKENYIICKTFKL